MLFPYFVYIAHFPKFTRESSLFMEKIFTHGKINSGRKSLGEKKEKKAGPKKKERVPLFQVKNKILL